MSELENLMQKLCPEGVEYKTLGEICELITKGTTPTTLGFSYEERGVNFVKVESIDENGCFILEKFAHISNDCHIKLGRSILEVDDVLFSIAGAIGRLAVVKENILPANTNQALAILRLDANQALARYIFFVLQTAEAKEQYLVKKLGAAQPNVSLNSLANIKIPIPPIEVQREIVRILDSFAELTAELTAELDARKKQYEYYRDKLLSFDDVKRTGGV